MAKEKRRAEEQPERLQRQMKIVEFNTEPEEEPRKRRRLGWLIFLLILVCLGAGVYWFLNYERSYNDFEVLSATENMDATQMSYTAYNGGLIKYNNEGISCLDKGGTVLWMESYKMKRPMVVVSGEYVAAADRNGNSVYIFNGEGKVNYIETPYPICNLDVASQGVFAVTLENETENYIELYDKFGENLAEIRTTVADSGYPLDIALSDDGAKLATSYITIEGIAVKNTIAMYNFDDVGQNVTDRLVGGFDNLGDTIVPRIEFLDNNTICAFGDNQFIFYSMKEKPSEKGVIAEFSGEVQSIFYNSNYVGAVEKEAGEEGGLYRLRVFDTSGNEKFSRSFDFTYHTIYATEEEIILVGASESRIYDFQGNLKFSYIFSKDVKNIIPTGSYRQYLVVYDDTTEVIRLQYTRKDGE